jgi:hypothetical protein
MTRKGVIADRGWREAVAKRDDSDCRCSKMSYVVRMATQNSTRDFHVFKQISLDPAILF